MSKIPISVCIIAKNEEKNIERCLSSLAPYGFEIVLVDTGSTDRTKELASKYTDRIFDFTWIDDFSAARNFSLEMASNNWIFMMDCDEWIESIDLEEMDYFRKHLSHAAGSVTRRNITNSSGVEGIHIDYTERLFSRKRYYYTGIIHEQLTPKFDKEIDTYLLNTTIGHSGYCMTPERRLSKSLQYEQLLLKQLEQEPDNPYVYFQLGRVYQMLADHQKACCYFEKGLSYDLNPELAYVNSMVVEYGYELLITGQKEKALHFQNIYDAFCSSADFVYVMGLIYLENKLYEEALDEFQKATTFEFASEEGANSYRSYYQIGHILSLAGEQEMAIKYFKLCENYPPALEALNTLKKS